jgi:hypothetical protein
MASIYRHPRASRIVQTLLIVSALLTAGCDTATGGGWIMGLHADRATFGFTVRCRDTRVHGMPVAQLSEGQLDWTDGFVSFHGIVDSQAVANMTCDEFADNSTTITFGGTYTPHHSTGSGTFTATVFDGGEPGALQDTISIGLTGGDYGEYGNAGPVQEGNVQVS